MDKRQVVWGWETGLEDKGNEDIARVEVGCLLGWRWRGCCDLNPMAAWVYNNRLLEIGPILK